MVIGDKANPQAPKWWPNLAALAEDDRRPGTLARSVESPTRCGAPTPPRPMGHACPLAAGVRALFLLTPSAAEQEQSSCTTPPRAHMDRWGSSAAEWSLACVGVRAAGGRTRSDRMDTPTRPPWDTDNGAARWPLSLSSDQLI